MKEIIISSISFKFTVIVISFYSICYMAAFNRINYFKSFWIKWSIFNNYLILIPTIIIYWNSIRFIFFFFSIKSLAFFLITFDSLALLNLKIIIQNLLQKLAIALFLDQSLFLNYQSLHLKIIILSYLNLLLFALKSLLLNYK